MQYMIPLIIITDDPENKEKMIKEIIQQNHIPAYQIFRVEPEKSELTIDQIRSVQKNIITSSSTLRLFILHSIDEASHEVQNALLKTLEEKSATNLFVLLGTRIDRVVPTIRSRAKIIEMPSSKKYSDSDEIQSFFESIASADMSFLVHPLIQKPTKESVINLIDAYVRLLRRRLIAGEHSMAAAIKLCMARRELLRNNNLNPQLAIDSLCIDIKRIQHSIS